MTIQIIKVNVGHRGTCIASMDRVTFTRRLEYWEDHDHRRYKIGDDQA